VPIYRLLADQGLDPEHCEAMAVAFEGLLQELGLRHRSDPVCNRVARHVIELGQQGVRDPKRLHELALAAIKAAG
jgi:hypothetical protein